MIDPTYIPLLLGAGTVLLICLLMLASAKVTDTTETGTTYPPRTDSDRKAARVLNLILALALASALMFTIYQGIKIT